MLKNPDICIIGSGAAGSFLAHSLKDSNLKVLILETGNMDGDSDMDSFIDKMNIHKESRLSYGFSKQVGGSTNLWAGRVAPFEAVDFDIKDKIPNSGWPIDLEDLIPFYNEASSIMTLPTHDYFIGERESAKNENIEGFIDKIKNTSLLDIKKFVWSSPPFNTRKTILKDIVDGQFPNIELVQNFHVTKLIEDENAQHIKCIELINANGEKEYLEPNKVVLAAGGIETVRILLNSKDKHDGGIANSYGAVGRYFSTHPKADMGVLMLNNSIPIGDPLFMDKTEGALSARQGIGLSQEGQRDAGYLNHYVQLTPVSEHTASNLFEKIKKSSSFNSKFINKNKVLRGFLPGLGLLVYEVIGRIAGLQRKSSKFILRTFLDQYPNAQHCVTLSNEKDAYGYPKVDITWSFTDEDKRSTLDFFAVLDKELQAQDVGHIEYSKLQELADWPITAIHSHFMGATRMGADEKTSVVNSDCCAHNYDNLYVVGPSVFPNYGYANPVYTIAALSLRLGAYLKQQSGQ